MKLVPIKLPEKYPFNPLTVILNTEAAAAFDDITRAGVREGIGRWGGTFRTGQFVPAVEYLRACRVRTLVMREMEETMSSIDAYIGGDDLTLTNLTGHPTTIVPDGTGERGKNDQPGTVTFTGKLFGETDLLTLSHAYQQASVLTSTARRWNDCSLRNRPKTKSRSSDNRLNAIRKMNH